MLHHSSVFLCVPLPPRLPVLLYPFLSVASCNIHTHTYIHTHKLSTFHISLVVRRVKTKRHLHSITRKPAAQYSVLVSLLPRARLTHSRSTTLYSTTLFTHSVKTFIFVSLTIYNLNEEGYYRCTSSFLSIYLLFHFLSFISPFLSLPIVILPTFSCSVFLYFIYLFFIFATLSLFPHPRFLPLPLSLSSCPPYLPSSLP